MDVAVGREVDRLLDKSEGETGVVEGRVTLTLGVCPKIQCHFRGTGREKKNCLSLSKGLVCCWCVELKFHPMWGNS